MRVSTTDLQNSFGKYLSLVKKENIIVMKNGKSVAKLIPYTEPFNYLVHEESKQYQNTRETDYEEYLALVESSDQRYELIDGQIYLLASPSYNHQVIVNELGWHFHNYFRDRPCRSLSAPLDVRLFGLATKFEEDPNIVQPDVVVICDEDKVNEDNKYHGLPTLIVEVLSPSTKGKDMISKLNLYMRSGVKEYWVVHLEKKSIFQYSFSEERDLDIFSMLTMKDTIESLAFPGLTLSLQELFSQL